MSSPEPFSRHNPYLPLYFGIDCESYRFGMDYGLKIKRQAQGISVSPLETILRQAGRSVVESLQGVQEQIERLNDDAFNRYGKTRSFELGELLKREYVEPDELNKMISEDCKLGIVHYIKSNLPPSLSKYLSSEEKKEEFYRQLNLVVTNIDIEDRYYLKQFRLEGFNVGVSYLNKGESLFAYIVDLEFSDGTKEKLVLKLYKYLANETFDGVVPRLTAWMRLSASAPERRAKDLNQLYVVNLGDKPWSLEEFVDDETQLKNRPGRLLPSILYELGLRIFDIRHPGKNMSKMGVIYDGRIISAEDLVNSNPYASYFPLQVKDYVDFLLNRAGFTPEELKGLCDSSFWQYFQNGSSNPQDIQEAKRMIYGIENNLI
ncbi:MAG: hypothetical protein SFU25_06635 [Candidatus Caenarcaniphilales bacterium]|nr:hypothetical protein [Candidatus Caenarcaniphilales bacterium]